MRFRFISAFIIIFSLMAHSVTPQMLSERGELELPDPNFAKRNGLTPLMIAVKSSQEYQVVRLLNAGANPNFISSLIEGGNAVSALSLAVDRGEFSIARRLVAADANGLLLSALGNDNPLGLPVCEIPLDARIWQGLARLQDNVTSPDWDSAQWALHRATRDGDWLEGVKLLDNGANPNKRDSHNVTPLMTAAWHGHDSMVSLLLHRGADIRYVDHYGVDAVSYAVAGGTASIIELLLIEALQTDPSRFDRGSVTDIPLETSPYYWAVVTDRPDILDYLIDLKLILPSRGEEGITLLMLAAWLSDTFSVRKLISLADDAGAQDDAGRTAMEWSMAAFARDRRIGLGTGQKKRGNRNYPIARLLVRRSRNSQGYRISTTPYIYPEIIEAWSPGGYAVNVEEWQNKHPSPVPRVPGDGDIILYRIFRDEEQE